MNVFVTIIIMVGLLIHLRLTLDQHSESICSDANILHALEFQYFYLVLCEWRKMFGVSGYDHVRKDIFPFESSRDKIKQMNK